MQFLFSKVAVLGTVASNPTKHRYVKLSLMTLTNDRIKK